MFDVNNIRKDFPILKRTVNGKPLVYFDNGATTQKPKAVIDCITKYYSEQNANIHRGVHTLSRQATILFEEARKTVSQFINAKEDEIIFTAGTTDSINIVAGGFPFEEGGEVIVTEMEHHSNILPWQLLVQRFKGKLRVIPVNKNGELQMDKLQGLINDNTALIAVTHVSNTLGTINPIEQIIFTAKQNNIPVLIDGAQAVPHMKVDVQKLDADFYVFSGHKIYAPTGVGVLWMKKKWMDTLPLVKAGGGTIKTVGFDRTEYVEGPSRFEPGTPNIEGVLGLAAAIKYMNEVGMDHISKHEHILLKYATEQLNEIPEVEIYANTLDKAAVISFNVKNAHPFDVGTLLDNYGVAVRTGHHCTQPLMHCFKIPGTVRASFGMYNTVEEINVFIEALQKSIKMLS